TYWHGAFGGLYLPHLRNAVYKHLIESEKCLESYERNAGDRFVEYKVRDLNFDAQPEVRLENEHAVAFLAPAAGGHLYELDIRPIDLNLCASLGRRPEAYHEKVRNAANSNSNDHVASI